MVGISCLGSARSVRRSGELFPLVRFERGARAGIFDGDPLDTADADAAWRLIVPPATGVFAPDLGGGTITLFGRLGCADFWFLFAEGGGPAGVFDRGPGTGLASDASSSSRYLSP